MAKSVHNLAKGFSILLVSFSPMVSFGYDRFGDDGPLESDPIDIDGSFSRPTGADRVRKVREENRQRARDAFEQQLESEQLRGEMELQKKINKKLKKAFSSGEFNNLDDSGGSGGEKASGGGGGKSYGARENAIIPRFDVVMFQNDYVDYTSSVSMGVGVETMVAKQIAIGVGFNYTTMEIEDTCGSNDFFYWGSYYQPFWGSGSGFCDSYSSWFGGQGREMKYKKLMFDLNGKFFFRHDTKIRPYLSAGLAFNRASLEYDDSGYGNPYKSYNFRNEGYSVGYLSGLAGAGAEIHFTEMIGAILDFTYSKSFTNGFSKDSDQDWPYYPDQRKLEQYGEDIGESHQFAIGLGLMVRF